MSDYVKDVREHQNGWREGAASRDAEVAELRAEVERLRGWKAQAEVALSEVQLAFAAAGDSAVPGDSVDETMARLRAQFDRALAERDEALAWVHDLQRGMYINCVYCGHRYGPNDEVPATMADALKEHVEQCHKHPMSALRTDRDQARRERDELRARVRALIESHRCGDHSCVWGSTGGMATQGGCQDLKLDLHELRRYVRDLAHEVRALDGGGG